MSNTAAGQIERLLADALAAHKQRQFGHAQDLYERVLRAVPTHFEALLLSGIAHCQAGASAAGLSLLERAAKVRPQSAEAHFNLGNALQSTQRNEDALASFERAIAIRPTYLEAHFNRGALLAALGHDAAALGSFDAVLAVQPQHLGALINRGNACAALGRHSEALASFERALVQASGNVLALYNCGNALAALGRYGEAVNRYMRVLAIEPAHCDACFNCANTFVELNRHDEAIPLFQRVLSARADHAQAWCNLGAAFAAVRRPAQALESFERALVLRPAYAAALLNRGNTLQAVGRDAESLASYEQALATDAHSKGALANRAHLLSKLGRYEEALVCFDRLLALDPDFRDAAGGRLYAALAICEWSTYAEEVERIERAIAADVRVAPALVMLAVTDSPELQRRCAQLQSADVDAPGVSASPLWRGERYEHKRLRVAYLSADFREHAVGHMTVNLFERHDRARFETYGIALEQAPGSALRQRLENAFDHFDDVGGQSDAEVARLLRSLEIDIAVDLMGLTAGCRPGIFAHRAAPVQVSYFGYAGTTGSSHIDYVIADSVVIPQADEHAYTEKVIRLPDTFFVTDGTRAVSNRTPARSECGLHEQGFVFCCFNNTYKITPPVFALWMQLLREIEGSVLWLSGTNGAAVRNLQNAATAHGVASERLVFASRVASMEDHLARYRVADLFLDTRPYNAHATAADALYAGLPVLTCTGRSFASRVCASLLNAIDAHELITSSLEEYAATALRLARNPQILRELRERLERGRETQPLFDTNRLRQHLEQAFFRMHEQSRTFVREM